jgi:flagellar assembly protein FliH
MTSRVKAASSPLLRWQFPELETSSKPDQIPPLAEADNASAFIDGTERSVSSDGEPSIDHIVEEEIAKGYSEGLQRGLTEGREKGHSEGIEAGTRTAEQALSTQVRRLEAIITRLDAPLSALERPIEEAVAALALEVARCVIGSETARSREYLVRLIHEAVAKVPIEMGIVKVILNPLDLDLIRTLAPEIAGGTTSLVGDDSVEPGDCLVVADGQGATIKDLRWRPRVGEGMSQVDLSLATRWRSVIWALFEGEEK